MKHFLDFARQFAAAPKQIGAVAPTGAPLAGLMAEAAELGQADAVVELGPGTGVITEQILARLRQGALFFAMEINPRFVSQTRERCPGATVYEASAAEIGAHLRRHGRGDCDCVISALPWTLFDDPLQDRILDAVLQALRPGGRFLTLAYLSGFFLPSARRFNAQLARRFCSVSKTRTVWRNVPPAFVYCCRK
jgi:phosphatidylethanolamine/phosphatidyl-N-methylethanolamine N-methyltransferase